MIFREALPPLLPFVFSGHLKLGISIIWYQNTSSASPCVTGWLFTEAVLLITSRREIRRRSSFRRRSPPSLIRVPLAPRPPPLYCIVKAAMHTGRFHNQNRRSAVFLAIDRMSFQPSRFWLSAFGGPRSLRTAQSNIGFPCI